MSYEATRKLVEDLDAKINEDDVGDPYFNNPSVHAFPLSKEGFRLIRQVKSGRKLAFVDGGNLELVGAPNFSVQMNRIYAGVWSEKNRITIDLPRIEFFSATFSTFKNDKLYYETVIVPGSPEFEKYLPNAKDLSFDSFDRSIMSGKRRAEIDKVASIARRFAEWKFASHIIKSLNEGDVLVLDGTLQTTFSNEANYLNELENVAKDNGVILSGLSKTSALFTTTGLSLLGSVSKLAEDYDIGSEWYYTIAESRSANHNAIILTVKLNRISERAYRYEIQRDQFKNLSELQLNEILTELVKESSDATFPGYPFGLIDADRFARVSYNELEYYRGLILSQMSEIGALGKFSRHIHATDAHSILNTLVGE